MKLLHDDVPAFEAPLGTNQTRFFGWVWEGGDYSDGGIGANNELELSFWLERYVQARIRGIMLQLSLFRLWLLLLLRGRAGNG